MERKRSDSYEIIWLVRRLFRALGQKSNASLKALGISVADRAVLEFLYPDERLSVPEIAARYQVSRQHVQVTVNALTDFGLLATRENPRHKRSPLIALTEKGRRLFSSIREEEDQIIEQLFSSIAPGDRDATRRTLKTLLARLT